LQSLILKGLASNTLTTLSIQDDQLNKTVMSFLQENLVPVASSCGGVGVCKKCIDSEGMLLCQVTLKDYLASKKEIGLSYY
jgi:hypothetical protein